MANWWDADPVIGKGTLEGDKPASWWESDPVLGRRAPSPVMNAPLVETELGPLGAGWKGAGSDLRTGVAALGAAFPETSKMLGVDPDALLKTAEESRAEVARRYKPKVPSFTDIGGIGDLGQYVYEQGAQSLPQMGAVLGAGALGMLAAPAAVPAAVAGVAAGTAAGLPFFVGQNIKEQMDEGKSLGETSLGTATVAGAGQAALDTLVGKVLPGVGKAAAGGMLVRSIKKGIEGGAIEGLTEAAQQAIQIGQANPTKLFEFGPEVQMELAEAAVAGGLLGTAIGAPSGAINKRAEPSPTEEEVLPPPTPPMVPMGTGLPGDKPEAPGIPSGTGLPDPGPDFKPMDNPIKWVPDGTGLPGPNEPTGIPSGTGLPDPGQPGKYPIPNTGQQVYTDIQQQLLAAGMPPIQANADAKMWRARYETLGNQLGIDAFSAYKRSGVEVRKGASGPVTVEKPDNEFNQDEPLIARHYSMLQSALNRIPMKQGTPEQWLNSLKKNGVKDEELEWTGYKDFLNRWGDKAKSIGQKITKEDALNAFRNYGIALYEAKPDVTKPNHYGEWTLGAYGLNPESNYREVVIADENQRSDTYTSPHYKMVPNALAHYRTTDRTTSDGTPVMMLEEVQSDWHQAGRERGYTTPEALDVADNKVQETYIRIAKRAKQRWPDLNGRNIADAIDRFLTFPPSWLSDEISAYRAALEERTQATHGVPNAPFKDTWPNLTFRHALFDAINSGKDYIAWPTGDQQAERYFARDNPTYGEKVAGMSAFYDKRLVDYANKLGKSFGTKVEPVNIDGTPVHAMRITPQMRELIKAGGLPLFQRGKTPQGNITITPDKAIIRLFKTSNPSTFMHESAHLWLEEMRRYAKENAQIAQDLKAVLDWFGVHDSSQIERKHHEMFARGFEQYLRTGKAPSYALSDIFKKFAAWLQKIYKQATDLKVKVPPQIAKVYDRLLAQEKGLEGHLRSSPLEAETVPPKTYSQTFNQAASTPTSPQQNKNSVYSVGQSAFSKVAAKTKAFFDPFSNIPQENSYRDLRNLMSGGVFAAEQSALKAKKLFSKLSQANKEKVNTYFDTAGADPMSIPADIRTETVALKNYINGPLKRALIDANLLPEKLPAALDDAYLPRLYLKHLVEMEGIKGTGARIANPAGKKRSQKTPDELLAMGEIKDPGVRTFHALFRTQRDLAVMDFLDKVAQNGDWALPQSLVPWNGKKVTPQWLKDEADHIEQSRIPSEPDATRKAGMKAIADRMRAAATQGMIDLNKADYDNTQYSQLPDSPDFGPLRGMIVRKQIAADIIGTNNFVDPNNTIDKWLGDRNSVLTKGVSIWKMLKVPLNPPSQIRNFASNMILLHLSGVPIHKIGSLMYRATHEILKDGKYSKIAQKYGVGRGTFTEQELYAVSDELKKLEANQQNGFAGWRAIYRGALKGAKTMTDFYQTIETLGKVAKIIDAMERQGMPENDAVREANKWLFDYSAAHNSIKRLRQMPIGMPFVSFQYFVAPLMAEVMVKHPTRLLPYIALAYTVPALVAASNDIDNEDAEKLRMSLSQNLRRKQSMYLLPWKDDAGRWQFVDIGYFMPWQMPFDVLKSSGEAVINVAEGRPREGIKKAGDAFQSSSLLSNPVLNIAAALTTGVDPFTDRPIADKRDPPSKQVWDIVGYAWSLVAPSLLAGYGAAGQLLSREQGSGMNRYGEPQTTYGQIGARAVGVNTYPVIPTAQRSRNIQLLQREIQDVKARLTSSLRDQSLTAEQRRKIMEQFKEELQDRNESLREYIRDSAPSERLRAATNQ